MNAFNDFTPCPFCTLSAIRIVEQNAYAVLILDGYPVSSGHSLNRPGFELTPRSWTNFKGFHEEVSNRVQARGRQKFFGR